MSGHLPTAHDTDASSDCIDHMPPSRNRRQIDKYGTILELRGKLLADD
jgi:hypothetical protein